MARSDLEMRVCDECPCRRTQSKLQVIALAVVLGLPVLFAYAIATALWLPTLGTLLGRCFR